MAFYLELIPGVEVTEAVVELSTPVFLQCAHKCKTMNCTALSYEPNAQLCRLSDVAAFASSAKTRIMTYSLPGFKPNLGVTTDLEADKRLSLIHI